MSMSSSVICGYGFPVDIVNGKTVLHFLINHVHTLAQMGYEPIASELTGLDMSKINFTEDANIGDLNLPESLFDSFSAWHGSDIADNYAKDIVAAIISHETDICVYYEPAQSDECRGEASILFEETMPWHLNEKEKTLTQDELKEILAPYATELGVDNNEIDNLEIEYYG